MVTPTNAQELQLPITTGPKPRLITEHGPSPIHYRKSPHIVLPTLRTAFGLQIRIPSDGFTGKVAATFDVQLGATIRFGRGATSGLLAEAGYSYVGFSEHLANLGVGILHGIGPAPATPGEPAPLGRPRFGIIPHVVFGSAYGGAALGARTSLLLGYWIYSVEVAHQVLLVGPRQVHEVHLVVGGLTLFREDE